MSPGEGGGKGGQAPLRFDLRACASGSISVSSSVFSRQRTLPRGAGRAHCVDGEGVGDVEDMPLMTLGEAQAT